MPCARPAFARARARAPPRPQATRVGALPAARYGVSPAHTPDGKGPPTLRSASRPSRPPLQGMRPHPPLSHLLRRWAVQSPLLCPNPACLDPACCAHPTLPNALPAPCADRLRTIERIPPLQKRLPPLAPAPHKNSPLLGPAGLRSHTAPHAPARAPHSPPATPAAFARTFRPWQSAPLPPHVNTLGEARRARRAHQRAPARAALLPLLPPPLHSWPYHTSAAALPPRRCWSQLVVKHCRTQRPGFSARGPTPAQCQGPCWQPRH
jgi:hypothetical protein